MKPLIGVTKPTNGHLVQNLAIRLCLFLSGARTVNLKVGDAGMAQEISGLVLSGGTDLHPNLYRSSEIKENYVYDDSRDVFEMEWLKRAKLLRLPIFCICRGAQLLNVYEGGTLHFNVAKVYENANYPNSLLAKIFYRKPIFVKSETKLDSIINKSETEVNSMHSQSIAKVGENLEVSAKEKNGVVQAIEGVKSQFIMGFQFHPEFLYYKKEIRKLFKEFVDACSRNE